MGRGGGAEVELARELLSTPCPPPLPGFPILILHGTAVQKREVAVVVRQRKIKRQWREKERVGER